MICLNYTIEQETFYEKKKLFQFDLVKAEMLAASFVYLNVIKLMIFFCINSLEIWNQMSSNVKNVEYSALKYDNKKIIYSRNN